MVCADTNVWIAFWAGETTGDTHSLLIALRFGRVVMAPPVLAELLSAPKLPSEQREGIIRLPLLPFRQGFWERCGHMRAGMFQRGLRPKLTDTIIAQLCLEHEIPLLTRDKDFQLFAKHSGLQLVR